MKRSPLVLRPTPEQLRTGSTLARSTAPIARQAINAVSPRRAAENRVRRKVLAEMRAEDPMCARCRVAPWVDGHELKRRSAAGSITDMANIIGLCRPCHEWVGMHPAQAIRDGWAISRFGDARNGDAHAGIN